MLKLLTSFAEVLHWWVSFVFNILLLNRVMGAPDAFTDLCWLFTQLNTQNNQGSYTKWKFIFCDKSVAEVST